MVEVLHDTPFLEVRDLHVSFAEGDRQFAALDGVSFQVRRGRTLCLVGESGCGKSLTAKAILQVMGDNARIGQGGIWLCRDGREHIDIAALDPRGSAIRSIRGNDIAMIYQEPMSALSPLYTIGDQISEVLRWHGNTSRSEAREEAIAVLRAVGMPAPEKRFDAYSFELSGGQRQRAMIAMALVGRPQLLIADEPTTALDVTTQAVILDLLRERQQAQGMAMLFITHDLGVVSEVADDVAVMYMGRIVESGPVAQVLSDPRHPYTRGLLASRPSVTGRRRERLETIPGTVPHLHNRPSGCAFFARCGHRRPGECDRQAPPPRQLAEARQAACWALDEEGRLQAAETREAAVARRRPDYTCPPLLKVRGLKKHFLQGGGLFTRPRRVRSLDGVSFDIWPGETLGLVGESGCGKSTLGQTVIGLHSPSEGNVFVSSEGNDVDLAALPPAARRRHWRDIRMVFQDPNGSFNPRLTVYDILAEVLSVAGESRPAIASRVHEVMRMVGLDTAYLDRHAHAFSGGQRQRIGIARALASRPRLIIADEPVSALDVSVQAQILNLLRDLQAELGLSYLFISHDLSVVRHISDRVAVMYAGQVVELAPTEELFSAPRHPYTRALLNAVLEPTAARRTERQRLGGSVPDPAAFPEGCRFHPRCPLASDECRHAPPPLAASGSGRDVACFHPLLAAEPARPMEPA